jgi:hypothetical protein
MTAVMKDRVDSRLWYDLSRAKLVHVSSLQFSLFDSVVERGS